jgi:hypothetical protein
MAANWRRLPGDRGRCTAAQVTKMSGKFVVTRLCMIQSRKKGATKTSKQRLFAKAVQEIRTSGKFVIPGLCRITLRKKVGHPAGRIWRTRRARLVRSLVRRT